MLPRNKMETSKTKWRRLGTNGLEEKTDGNAKWGLWKEFLKRRYKELSLEGEIWLSVKTSQSFSLFIWYSYTHHSTQTLHRLYIKFGRFLISNIWGIFKKSGKNLSYIISVITWYNECPNFKTILRLHILKMKINAWSEIHNIKVPTADIRIIHKDLGIIDIRPREKFPALK